MRYKLHMNGDAGRKQEKRRDNRDGKAERWQDRVTSEGGAMGLHIGYDKGDPCLEQQLDWLGINGE